ncbi:phosphatidylethanolamine-binding protein homolog F40A3.3-like [Styela clava]
MTDPDAPSRDEPKFREWYHWGVINIPGNDVSKGEEIAAYVGAGPPKGTGKHRYVILVFKQSGKVNYTGDKLGMTMDGRAGQKIDDIVKKHNLGKILAGACFQAEWDDYVPELYKKFK